MILQERMKLIRRELGISADKLASELTEAGYGITSKTIAGYESGLRQPSVSFLTGLSTVYECNPVWLLTGKGEVFTNTEHDYKVPTNLNFNNIVFIPHVDLNVSAGYGSVIDNINMTQDFMAFAKSWLFNNVTAPLDNLVLFTVNGDSMDCPTSQIKDGGLVLVDTTANDFRKDGIYVISIDDSLFVKRLQIMPGKMLRVKSDNPSYDPFDVSLESDSVKIIGRVVWAGSKLDTIK